MPEKHRNSSYKRDRSNGNGGIDLGAAPYAFGNWTGTIESDPRKWLGTVHPRFRRTAAGARRISSQH
jgi:hypothetical protein